MFNIPEELKLDEKKTVAKLKKFIRDTVMKTGHDGVVLGISGGIDSALVLGLASEALGSNNVTGIFMPGLTSTPSSIEDGIKLCRKFGVLYDRIDLKKSVNGLLNSKFMSKNNSSKMHEIVSPRGLGNIMARMRMIILYDRSLALNRIVIGTSNKTEILLGYGTLFGDTACGMMPIADLYKSQVRQLSKYIGVPDSILRKAPSAELEEGQTDEQDFGYTYEELDRVLFRIVDQEMIYDDLIDEGFSEEIIEFCYDTIDNMLYKSQLPPMKRIN